MSGPDPERLAEIRSHKISDLNYHEAEIWQHIDAQAQQLADSQAQVAVLVEAASAELAGHDEYDMKQGWCSHCAEPLPATNQKCPRCRVRMALADTAAAAEACKRQLRLEGADTYAHNLQLQRHGHHRDGWCDDCDAKAMADLQ